MASTAGHMLGDIELAVQPDSIPESDLRTSSHVYQVPFYFSPNSQYEWTGPTPTEHRSKARRLSRNPGAERTALFADTDLHNAFANMTSFDLAHSNVVDSSLAQTTRTSDFPSLSQYGEFAEGLVSFQPCDDCTPSTKTTIPHHHHSTSRLNGVSAQLAGHFCCYWLVDGQPCFLCFEPAEALDNHIKADH